MSAIVIKMGVFGMQNSFGEIDLQQFRAVESLSYRLRFFSGVGTYLYDGQRRVKCKRARKLQHFT